MRNLAFEIVPEIRVLVSYQGKADPTDEEWDAWLALAQDALQGPGPWRALVVTEGGHPSKAQQDRLARMMKGRSAPTAVVSSGAVLRFVVTMLTFANRELKCFSPLYIEAALRFIGLQEWEYPTAKAAIHRLQGELSVDGQAPEK